MKQLLTTVIIPCYNYGRFLQRAVDSVLNQTYKNFEVIVVDDYSTDNTPSIVKKYEEDPRVQYIRQEKNVGQSENRNSGIRAAKGEFVALLDADDWWDSQFLENTIPEFEDKEVGVVYTLQSIHHSDGTIKTKKYSQIVDGYVYNELFVSNFIGTPVVFRKCAIPAHGYDTNLSPHLNNLGVDWWILLEISTKYKIIGINKPLYNYNVHDQSISKNVMRRIEADRIIQQKFLKQFPTLLSKKAIREARFWSFYREGLYLRTSGKRWSACLSYLKSLIIHPLNLLSYKSFMYTLLKG